MSLPQFHDMVPNGMALNDFGLSNGPQFDPLSLLISGLAFPRPLIWFDCAVISGTTWSLCTTYGATWTLAPTVSTTWTVT